MGIAQRTLRGIFWVYASFFGGRLLTLASTAILGRILIPEDFGVVAFALVFLSFIEAVRSFGVNDALIYTSEHVEESADTVFVINLGLGIAQYVIAFLAAPLLMGLFDDPRIVDVVRVMSLTMVLDALGRTHDALLQKEMEFRRRFLPDLIASIIKGVVSVIMALTGFGIWSLVLGNLIGSAARTIAKWWVLSWRPSLRFYMARARALWNYGVHILLFEVLNIALEQADQLLVALLMGQLQLGYYSIAMRIPELVIANFSMVLTRVLFPAYAKMKSDMTQLTRGFMATTRYTAYITVPLGFGMAAVAPELVLVIFGEQWEPSIILLQVLALMGTAATLPWSTGDVFKAIGRPDVLTKLLVIEAIVTFPLIYVMVVGTHLAVMAALANLISLIFTAILRLFIITRFLDVGKLELFKLFQSPFLASMLMFAGVTTWRSLTSDWPMVVTLGTSVLLGMVIYTGLMWILERDSFVEARDMLLSTVRRSE